MLNCDASKHQGLGFEKQKEKKKQTKEILKILDHIKSDLETAKGTVAKDVFKELNHLLL